MLTVRTVGAPQRYPWGWQARVDYVDASGAFVHECVVFAAEPDAKALAKAVEAKRAEADARLVIKAPELETVDGLRDKVTTLTRERDQFAADLVVARKVGR